MKERKKEGFNQASDFVLKREGDVYDPFYLGEYDALMKTDERIQFEVAQVLQTNPSIRESVFLDIGCGTCKLLTELNTYGFQTFGLDKSKDVLAFAKEKNRDLEVKIGDANELMTYDKGTFTHVMCMYFTIYEFEDKRVLLRNIYHWLKMGGYFIVHLVDETKFNMISPCAKVRTDLVNEFLPEERMRKSTVSMPTYTYSSTYNPVPNSSSQRSSTVMFKETFENKSTKQIRQNERNLFWSGASREFLESVGFSCLSSISYESVTGDDCQSICTFVKI